MKKITTIAKFGVLLGLFLISSVNSVYCLNRGEIRSQIRMLVNDTDTDTSLNRWTDAQLNQRIEMAQLDIIARSRGLTNTTYYTMVTSISVYALPQDLLTTNRVAYYIRNTTGAYKKMERMTLLGLDEWNNYWQQLANGLPERYYIWSSTIGIVPPPTVSYSGYNNLRIDYTVIPSSFVSDTSVPFNNVTYLYPYHELIIWYVVYWCKMDEKLYQESTFFGNRYYDLLKIMYQELNSKEDWFPDFKFGNYYNK